MEMLLEVLVVVFTAFGIWLTVRIINRRERSAKWTLAAAVVALALYVLSFGPACWWCSEIVSDRDGLVVVQAPYIYWPVGWAANRRLPGIRQLLRWYGTLAGNPGVVVPACADYDDGWLDQAEFFMTRP